jgi:dihydrofolate reductase
MKAKVYIGTSLDGFIAREDGDIGWLVQYANEEAVKAYKEFMSGIDAILIGRGTFEKILSFPSWPYDKPAFLLSTTIKQVPDELKDKITLLSMKPVEVLKYLNQKGFSNIYVDGGKVIQSFLREDLIDELTIARVPCLIGSGLPLFGHLDKDIQFKHIRTEIHSNELVRSYYERKR